MLKNNSERGKNIIIAFWFLFGIILISIISTYFEYNLLEKARTGAVTLSEATANDTRQRMIGIAEILMRVVVIVLMIMWLRRAYYNIRSLGFSTRYTDGWAAGAWFVPFMNLYAPYQIVKEVWDNTQFKAQQNSPGPIHRPSTIIGAWWALWILTNLFENCDICLLLNPPEIKMKNLESDFPISQFRIFKIYSQLESFHRRLLIGGSHFYTKSNSVFPGPGCFC